MNYTNRVKSVTKNKIYSLPINLSTINQFYKKNFSPSEAKIFVKSISKINIVSPKNFEQQAMKFIGARLYRAFLKGYTEKQWGRNPKKIPASVLKRLPVRYNYNDNYFFHKYQGIPRDGYTKIIKSMLNNSLIDLQLNTKFSEIDSSKFDYIFFSGPVDEFFNYKLGELEYRTLDFEEQHHCCDDFQGTAVINYGDKEVPYTRISEHKHFAPWEYQDTHGTVIYKEFSRKFTRGDIEYYPVRLAKDKSVINDYNCLTKECKNVTFVGRLGTYRYLDMDKTIEEALNMSKTFVRFYKKGGIKKVISERGHGKKLYINK
jgi:UDP-galactopyranose mutase